MVEIIITKDAQGQIGFKVQGNANMAEVLGLIAIAHNAILNQPQKAAAPPILVARGALPTNGRG